ncbi:MbnP family protein [Flavobacterium aciduliphilum]|uniref:Copper-binding protein MbnP-like domain-containing protein n=1 Tax=Flavobacterium aciduliphilum TaxID=1101402 RepID=A0A328Y624_9FLAO|nr:MbnP family protein [Flavobacterium aciduliphilum]RAR69271.1 hypothetical protein CLV55_1189 [Flavobacterium aciduliphilum]
MKNNIKKAIALLVIATTLISCSKSEDAVSGTGSLKIQFENGFAGNELVLGAANMPTSQNEVLKVSSIKYIVSNIVLTKEDGSTFTYPKASSYFIVDESTPSSLILNLSNVPAANYKSITFGIGVDQAQYELGQTGIADFWTTAQNAGMTWSWASGFKFLAFEGTFTSSTVTTDTSFMIHTGKTGTDYNYTEVSLALPEDALVRTNITPQIHLSTDLSKIIDGTNKINLTAHNGMGMGAMIMGGSDLPLITANLSSMFTVEHVHNNPN